MTTVEAEEDQVVVDLRGEPAPEPTPQQQATPPATDRRRRSTLGAVAIVSAAIVGSVAVWFLVYGLVLTGLQEHGSQARLYDRFRLQLAAATAPIGGAIKSGSPVALVSSPAAAIRDQVVVEGTTSGLLRAGPGHLSDTPLPGQAGISVMLGRSVTFGRPFAGVTRLKVGDEITVTTGQGVFTYRVYDVWHPGDAQPRRIKANQSGLALVTSTSAGWRSGWAPSHTVYVYALGVKGSVQPSPAGRPGSVSKASLPMQANPKGLLALIFWFEAVVIVGLAAVWSWKHWGHRQTWLVGVPVVLAVLWGMSGSVMQFLPNLV